MFSRQDKDSQENSSVYGKSADYCDPQNKQ
jgi:hypothetical protein